MDEQPTTDELREEIGDDALILMLDLMNKSARENQDIINSLHDSDKRDLHRARAELRILKGRIATLASLPYVANPGAYLDALYVEDNEIDSLVKKYEGREHMLIGG